MKIHCCQATKYYTHLLTITRIKYYECLFLSQQYKKAACLTFQQTQESFSKASQSFTQFVSSQRLLVHNTVYRVIFQSLVK
jgi:hypothetical protein